MKRSSHFALETLQFRNQSNLLNFFFHEALQLRHECAEKMKVVCFSEPEAPKEGRKRHTHSQWWTSMPGLICMFTLLGWLHYYSFNICVHCNSVVFCHGVLWIGLENAWMDEYQSKKAASHEAGGGPWIRSPWCWRSAQFIWNLEGIWAWVERFII